MAAAVAVHSLARPQPPRPSASPLARRLATGGAAAPRGAAPGVGAAPPRTGRAMSAVAAGAACLAARGAGSQARGRLSARRCAPYEGSALVPVPAKDDEDDDLGDASGSCSIWHEPPCMGISEKLLKEAWAPQMDKLRTIEDSEVRACRKGAKQVATLGPASSDKAMLERLFLCGVDVFRLNFSHGEHDEKIELITRIRELEDKYKHPLCILADMQGPKQRCGKFAHGEVQLTKGQHFRFDLDDAPGDESRVQLPHEEILLALEPGRTLLLDDGKIRMTVVRSCCIYEGKELTLEDGAERPCDCVKECPPFVECVVEVGGKLSSRKGVNTPDVVLPISPITAKDQADIEFACENDVDWIALSFVQKHEDMVELRDLIQKRRGDWAPKILAKIEKPCAVKDLEKIIEKSDGVMVARGDLGVEMKPEEVPFVQKDIIRKAHAAGKPVIVATQMLESMIHSPTPTRAECSDVANAILDGCDAVMLSGETAVGEFPTECVEMQRRVIEASEAQFVKDARNSSNGLGQGALPPSLKDVQVDHYNAVVAAAKTLGQGVGAKAIICFTRSGKTVERLAKLRPSVPILAVCNCLELARWLSLLRGVYATSDPTARELASRVLKEGPYSVRFTEAMEVACQIARQKGLATHEDDTLVVIARLPLFTEGKINCIRLASALGPAKADGYGPDEGRMDRAD